MKQVLKHPKIDQDIEISKDVFFNVIIENPWFLREYLFGIKNQLDSGEEYLLYYEDNKEGRLDKIAFLIDNPLNIIIDDKKTNLSVQKDVASHITLEQKEQFELLMNSINDYITSISYDYALPLSFDLDMSLTGFLKAISISINNETSSFIETLLIEIKKLVFVFKYRLFFFYNIHDILTKEELISFLHQLDLMEVGYILISSHRPIEKLDQEFLIEIDDDLCELCIEPTSQKS